MEEAGDGTRKTQVLFENIDGEQQITEIDSLCMACHQQGLTKLLLTKIPHFKEIIIMAFECLHCGLKNNEIQSASTIAEKGVMVRLCVQGQRDLSRQVVKGEYATVRFEELDFEIPSDSQRGILSTIDGIIDRAIEGLRQGQEDRLKDDQILHDQIEKVLSVLQDYYDSKLEFTFTLNDPTGNSYIENLDAPSKDSKATYSTYTRTRQQEICIGLPVQELTAELISAESTVLSEHVPLEQVKIIEESILVSGLDMKNLIKGADDFKVLKEGDDSIKDDAGEEFDLEEQVHVFEGACSRCHSLCATKMHMLDIPHFKQVIIMSTNCDECGFKSNEVKAGGAVSSKGQTITLTMLDSDDLSRDILKSESCGISIPEIELELTTGTLGGRFTTVEGLLQQVYDELDSRSQFLSGDSSTEESGGKFKVFLQNLKKILDGQSFPVTLILHDPLANSHLQNLYAPDPDPNMVFQDFERTFEDNEDYGLNDMLTENYEA